MIMKLTDFCQLFPEDIKLVEQIRLISYGEITIKLRGGKPVTIEKGVQTIKLEDERNKYVSS